LKAGNREQATDLSGEQAGFVERVTQALYRMRRRIATGAVIAAALAFGYHAIFGENGLNVYEQRRAEDRAEQKQIGELEKENARLAERVKALRSDPDAIEREARERLHYARPGEVIWTEDGAGSPTNSSSGQPVKK
jgi:cell division protein FtsB